MAETLWGKTMHCALKMLRGQMLIGGDIAGEIYAVLFDGNVAVGDVVGETLLADIALGDNTPCNSNTVKNVVICIS